MVIRENATAKAEYRLAKTMVVWDMETCPIPDGFDARWIRPTIECALTDLGYYGPVTITAIGDLEIIPPHVLLGLTSTGIDVQHSLPERVRSSMQARFLRFVIQNRPPATKMIISDQMDMEMPPSYGQNKQWFSNGYNLAMVRSYTRSSTLPGLCASAEWKWKSFLEYHKQETYVLRESGEFKCASCFYTATSLEDLTRHLSSEKHKQRELDTIISRLRCLQLRVQDQFWESQFKRRRALFMDFRLVRIRSRLRSLRARQSSASKYMVPE